ncbi:MAG: alpha/beta fold hydrolase [bacterium]
MAQAVCNGIQISFDDTAIGSPKPPIVFLHAHGLNRSMWDKQRQVLRATRRVVTYDLRGHGGSEKPVTGYTREEEIKDLEGLLEVINAPKAHLVGTGRGADVALGFAAAHPEKVISLIAMSAGYDFDRHMPEFGEQRIQAMATIRAEGLRAAKEYWMSLPIYVPALENEELADRIDQIMLGYTGPHWLDADPPKDPSLADAVPAITARTRIMVGDRDLPGFQACADELAEKITGAEKQVVEGAGHLISLEAPDAVTEGIESFVSAAESS